MKEILIKGEFIKLSAFLKFSGLFATGGNAKTEIENGKISVNNEVCYIRGKKLRNGDIVTYNNTSVKVVTES
ncbi:MAG: RNA-binding S4 domain-containing protein [Clostridia bacterium]|nr:RNA-binding S4 domain-containing protein [Clostridia bacterium]